MTTRDELFQKCVRSFNGITDADIDKLSLPFRVCWHLYPWTVEFRPTSIEEWAYTIGWLRHKGKMDRDRAIDHAISEVTNLISFLTRELLLFGADIDKAAGGVTTPTKEVFYEGTSSH